MPTRPSHSVLLTVNDIDKTYEYLTKTLGFTPEMRMKGPNGATMHGEVRWGKGDDQVAIMIGSVAAAQDTSMYDSGEFGQNLTKGPLGNGVVLFFRVPNVDKFYAKITANGAIIDEPPTDQMWGDRTISVLTPDNYYLTFYAPIKGFKWPAEMAASMVNERPKLSKAQRNQRRYAGKMTGIRGRAAKAKGGKGRIANRAAAKKARKDLGVGEN